MLSVVKQHFYTHFKHILNQCSHYFFKEARTIYVVCSRSCTFIVQNYNAWCKYGICISDFSMSQVTMDSQYLCCSSFIQIVIIAIRNQPATCICLFLHTFVCTQKYRKKRCRLIIATSVLFERNIFGFGTQNHNFEFY